MVASNNIKRFHFDRIGHLRDAKVVRKTSMNKTIQISSVFKQHFEQKQESHLRQNFYLFY